MLSVVFIIAMLMTIMLSIAFFATMLSGPVPSVVVLIVVAPKKFRKSLKDDFQENLRIGINLVIQKRKKG